MTCSRLASCVLLAIFSCNVVLATPTDDVTLPLTRGNDPACKIVVLGDDPLLTRAAEMITRTTETWSGVRLGHSRKLETGPAVVLGTLDSIRPEPDSADLLRRLSFADPHAFACFASGDRVFVVGRSPRGAFNGAVHLKEMAIDGPKDGLVLRVPKSGLLRTPQMAARGTYLLGIYGVMPQHDVAAWKGIFDSFAEDGMERIYFWTSGHFPSKKFPQTFNRDAALGTKIGAEAALRELVTHAHLVGLKFYIGSGAFAWTNAAFLAEDTPAANAKGVAGLCPSNPVARQRTIDSLCEMYDAMPEADGIFLEVRDEHGECQCEVCQKPVDSHGSKQYGVSELSFLRELATKVWEKHPHARFSWNIGYAEHAKDVVYYQTIREMSDPRFEWIECRGSWSLPAADGKKLPMASFSRQAIHWDLLYEMPLKGILEACNRTAREGLYGYVPAFSPGYDSADYYGQQVPYPVDLVPYNVTRFAFRELTWEPTISEQTLRDRVRERFFGQGGSPELATDLCNLHDFIVANAAAVMKYSQDWYSYDTRLIPRPVLADQIKQLTSQTDAKARAAAAKPLLKNVQKFKKIRDEGLPMLNAMEKRIQAAETGAQPKARQTLSKMRKAIDDTRKHFKLAIPDPAALGEYESELTKASTEIK